jgi:hypothetical protein
MSQTPIEKRKAAIKQFLEFAKDATCIQDELTWTRHAVGALYQEIFNESLIIPRKQKCSQKETAIAAIVESHQITEAKP